jgi:BirA family biotin operon repressor/biotin-[acetyl-CoA-carboxylase] ligase
VSPPARPSPVRVGLWGTFDVDNYGDLLLAHIGSRELSTRLPGAVVRPYSPFGWFHPVGFEGVDLPEPLGVWSPERAVRLASELDCVVIGGGDLIHTEVESLAHAYGIDPTEMRSRDPSRFFIDGLGTELERELPVVWSAVGVPADLTGEVGNRVRSAARDRPYLAVRDDISRLRLERAGVEGAIEVVPDPAVLLPRTFPPDRLEPALEHLVRMDWFPRAGPAVAVQANGLMVPWVPALTEAIRSVFGSERVSVVTLEIGPCHGDGEFAHALHGALEGSMPVYHVPGTARLEHIAAAIWGAAAFIGSSLHGSITAFAYGRPYVMLHGVGLSKIEGFAALVEGSDQVARMPEELPEVLPRIRGPDPGTVTALQDRVDAHFDRVARIAEEAGHEPRVRAPREEGADTVEGAVLVQALRDRERRLVAERDSLLARLSGLGVPTGDQDPEVPDGVRLERAVRDAGILAPFHYLPEVDSTNARGLEMARDGAPEWTVVVAGHQTAGRGRLGRRWLDVPGRSLLCSVILRPRLTPNEVYLLTLAAAVSVIDAARLPGLDAKWPNDIVVGERKCGGILAEADVQGGSVRHVVLGIGVNVSAGPEDLPEEVRDTATSLAIEGASIDRDGLLGGFLGSLRGRLQSDGFPASIVEAYRPLCRTLGRRVRATTTSGDPVEGRAVDVDERGSLLVERRGRVERVAFGEVEHVA